MLSSLTNWHAALPSGLGRARELQPSPRPPSGPGPAACHVALLLLLLLLLQAASPPTCCLRSCSVVVPPVRTARSGPRFPLCLKVFNVTSIRFYF